MKLSILYNLVVGEISDGGIARKSGSLKKLLDADLPIPIAAKMRRLGKSVQSEMQLIEDQRIALIKKYDSTGKGSVDVDKINQFGEDMKAFLDGECELPPVQITLQDINSLHLSAIDLINLEFLIDGEPETKKE